MSTHAFLQLDERGLCLAPALKLGPIEKEPVTPATASDLALDLAAIKLLSHDRVMGASNNYDDTVSVEGEYSICLSVDLPFCTCEVHIVNF